MIRHALVTGGSAGLGAAFVAQLHAEGFAVTSIDRDAPSANLVGVRNLRASLENTAELPALLAGIDADTRFDLVVLNAGISAVGAFEKIPVADLDRLIAINLLAPIELTRLLMSGGRLSDRASLIFVGSLSNRLGYPGASVYAASKQGLEAFAASLRKGGRHAVLCVLPGPLDTDHARRYAPRDRAASRRQAPAALVKRVLARRHRSGTVYGTPVHQLAGLAGRWLPDVMTELMRRGLFRALRSAPPITDEHRRDPMTTQGVKIERPR